MPDDWRHGDGTQGHAFRGLTSTDKTQSEGRREKVYVCSESAVQSGNETCMVQSIEA